MKKQDWKELKEKLEVYAFDEFDWADGIIELCPTEYPILIESNGTGGYVVSEDVETEDDQYYLEIYPYWDEDTGVMYIDKVDMYKFRK